MIYKETLKIKIEDYADTNIIETKNMSIYDIPFDVWESDISAKLDSRSISSLNNTSKFFREIFGDIVIRKCTPVKELIVANLHYDLLQKDPAVFRKLLDNERFDGIMTHDASRNKLYKASTPAKDFLYDIATDTTKMCDFNGSINASTIGVITVLKIMMRSYYEFIYQIMLNEYGDIVCVNTYQMDTRLDAIFKQIGQSPNIDIKFRYEANGYVNSYDLSNPLFINPGYDILKDIACMTTFKPSHFSSTHTFKYSVYIASLRTFCGWGTTFTIPFVQSSNYMCAYNLIGSYLPYKGLDQTIVFDYLAKNKFSNLFNYSGKSKINPIVGQSKYMLANALPPQKR
jgi:hypothetical protein